MERTIGQSSSGMVAPIGDLSSVFVNIVGSHCSSVTGLLQSLTLTCTTSSVRELKLIFTHYGLFADLSDDDFVQSVNACLELAESNYELLYGELNGERTVFIIVHGTELDEVTKLAFTCVFEDYGFDIERYLKQGSPKLRCEHVYFTTPFER